MKKLNILVFVMFLALGSMFAQETVVDVTGNNFTHDEYVGTYGRQILVAENGDVHVAYQKSFATAADTGYNLTWKNITTGATGILPAQPTDFDGRPDRGIVYIGGGNGEAPIFFYTGNGGWTYKWGDMQLQAMSKVNAAGDAVEALGVQPDKNYYHQPYYANPISMEVSAATGIAHCILTNVGGDAIAYWNFDGTNFGEIYQMYFVDSNNDVPGKAVPGKFRRNASDGADLAVNSDGSEVTVAGLHKACNIWLHKGVFGGELWDDDFFVAMDNGTCIGLFDTTDTGIAENIPESEPKPYTDLQVVYDENDKLAVAYTATYVSLWADTARMFGGWTMSHTSLAGDTVHSFYDGADHPKLQLRFWSEASGTHSQITESTYPLAGTTIDMFEDGVYDSGRAFVGQGINDAFISHFNMISNKDAQDGEPKLVIAFQMATSQPELAATGYERGTEPYMRWIKYYSDIFVAQSFDGATWEAPVNVTDTPEKNEVDLSIARDVIDGNIHMLYFRSNEAGTDDWGSGVDTAGTEYTYYSSNGNWGIPIRLDQDNQVDIVYNKYTLTASDVSDPVVPGKFELSQNYPNPFNPTTVISYSIPARSDVNIKVYNNLGELVTTLFDGVSEAGSHEVSWNASNISTGVYFYSIKAGNFTQTKKMILLK